MYLEVEKPVRGLKSVDHKRQSHLLTILKYYDTNLRVTFKFKLCLKLSQNTLIF